MKVDKKNSKYIEEKQKVHWQSEKYSLFLLVLKLLGSDKYLRRFAKWLEQWTLGRGGRQWSRTVDLWWPCSQESQLILIIEIFCPSPSHHSCLLQPGSCFQLFLVHQSIALIFSSMRWFSPLLSFLSFRAKQSQVSWCATVCIAYKTEMTRGRT